MLLHIPGESPVTLTQSDFVASGGEGSVYAKGGHAYKVWSDPGKGVPEAKLRALMGIDVPGVVRPTAPLVDDQGRIVGLRMDWLDDTWPLCRLVPASFRSRHGLDEAGILDLLVKLRRTVERVHRHNALIVDLNELNVLVSRDFATPYIIDVDSWQAGGFAATAIMPSVIDFTAPEGQFTELTDWYAFAVLAALLLLGVHPYKGQHPKVKGLEARARAKLPVWHPAVKAPPAMRPLDQVPSEWRGWFVALFERGERRAPPTEAGAQPLPAPVRLTAGTGLTLSALRSFDGAVLGVRERLGTSVVWTTDSIWVDGHRRAARPEGLRDVVFSPRRNAPVAASVRDGRLHLLDLHSGESIPLALHADDAVFADGRLIVKTGAHLLELTLLDGGKKLAATATTVAQVLPHATRLFEGVAVQDLLGTAWLSVFPERGVHLQLRIPELDGATVVEAKGEHGVIVLSVRRGAEWQRVTVRYDPKRPRKARWDVRTEDVDAPPPVSLTVLETGVAVMLDENGGLRLFGARVGSASTKSVADPGIDPGWHLQQRAGRVVAGRDNELIRISLAA